jgi:hypothetical protein
MSDPRAPTDDRQSLLHRYRWQLDALRCGLADSMRELREAEAVLVQLHGLQRAARDGAAAVSDRLDPLHLRAVVTYLGQLVERIEQQTRHRDQLISLCSLKRRDCAEAEAQLAEIEGQALHVSAEGVDGSNTLNASDAPNGLGGFGSLGSLSGCGSTDGLVGLVGLDRLDSPDSPDSPRPTGARRSTTEPRVIEMMLPGV